jgi:hypothetical protein
MSIIMNRPMHEEDLSHPHVSGRQWCKQPDRFGVFAEGALDSMADEEEVDNIVVEAEVDEEEVVMVDYSLPFPPRLPDAPPRAKPRIHIHIILPLPIAAKTTPKNKPRTQDLPSKLKAKSKKRTKSSVSPLAKPNSNNLFPAVPEATPEAVILDTLPPVPRQVTLPSIPCLPNGDFQSWKHFLPNGRYVSAKGKVMSTNKQTQVLAFVSPISNRPFHCLFSFHAFLLHPTR